MLHTQDDLFVLEQMTLDQRVKHVLSLDGPIGKLLSEVKEEFASTRELRNLLTLDFEAIGKDYKNFRRFSIEPTDFFYEVLSVASRPGQSVVLRSLIATLSGDYFLDLNLHELAKARYISRCGDYDAVLQHLIPGEWRGSLTLPDTYLPLSTLLGTLPRRTDKLGLSTGLAKVDAALGSLQGLTFLAGDRGIGKTTLMLASVIASLKNDPGLAVVFLSLDMDRITIQQRLLCSASSTDFCSLTGRELSSKMRRQLEEADASLRATVHPRLLIEEQRNITSDGGLSMDSLLNLVSGHKVGLGVERVALLIDLFQRVDPPSSISASEADTFRLTLLKQVRDATRTLTQPKGIPILVSSEIRKGTHPRRELTQDDLIGSGRLASDADNILLMTSLKKKDGRERVIEPLNLRIEKGRDGVQRIDIPLWFAHTKSQFFDTLPASSARQAKVETQSPKLSRGLDPLAGD